MFGNEEKWGRKKKRRENGEKVKIDGVWKVGRGKMGVKIFVGLTLKFFPKKWMESIREEGILCNFIKMPLSLFHKIKINW